MSRTDDVTLAPPRSRAPTRPPHGDEARPLAFRYSGAPGAPASREPGSTPVAGTAIELSIVMPCLNEARTVATCIAKARSFLHRAGVVGEVVIADNGSTDGSVDLARAAGAVVVQVADRGYGAALQGGIAAARGRFIVMGDADDSYDFTRLDGFLARLREGADLVMGNRFAGGILPGAMPPLHRYLGNPVLSLVGRLLFRSPVRDFHCGLRGFRRDVITSLGLTSPGMEFASEMVVKATLSNLVVTEVPTTLSPDGRDRAPHLRSWRDGWRHLRFLLMMSPRWLMFYPGALMLGLGLAVQLAIAAGPLRLGPIGLDIHTMLYGAAASVLGLQLILFSIITRTIGLASGVMPATRSVGHLVSRFNLERGLSVGLALGATGFALALRSVMLWTDTHLSTLDPSVAMRTTIPAVGLMLAGAEVMFTSFVLALIRSNVPPAR